MLAPGRDGADRRRHAERLCLARRLSRPGRLRHLGRRAGRSSKIGRRLDAARAAGMPVIFFQNGWDPDYVEAGGPGSPNWHKSNALKTMRAQARAAGQAAGQGRLGLRAGRRAAAAARRHRRRQAALQRLLQHAASTACCARAASATLVFIGIATNVCVESTLRDGFFLEYFGVVLEDATHHAGPDFIQEASALQRREVLRLGLRRSTEFRDRACRPTSIR